MASPMRTASPVSRRTYSLADLCATFGFTPRQIHDFRSKGALQAPDGTGRGARYTEEHVQRLAAIKPLLEEGISVSRVAARFSPAPEHTAGGPHEDPPSEMTTERWDRVRIGPDLEIGLSVGGALESLRGELLRALAQEAKRLSQRN